MSCLLCHDKNLSLLHQHAVGRALFRCARCGLLQTVPMPTEAELAAYYQRYDILGEREPYYQAMWGPAALETPEGRDVRERFFWAKKFCGRFGRTLDVGSGPGLFLRLVKAEGGEPQGVELNARAAERSVQDIGVPVKAGAIAAVTEKDFDVIALWDLVEHVADPVGLVKACQERLRSGGWLFIETPNEASLLDGAVRTLARLGRRGSALTFYGWHHLVLFRPKTIRRLLESQGFKVIAVAGAETTVGRIFRGNGFKDKMTRLGLGALFFAARLVDRRNKMLIAAKKI